MANYLYPNEFATDDILGRIAEEGGALGGYAPPPDYLGLGAGDGPSIAPPEVPFYPSTSTAPPPQQRLPIDPVFDPIGLRSAVRTTGDFLTELAKPVMKAIPPKTRDQLGDLLRAVPELTPAADVRDIWQGSKEPVDDAPKKDLEAGAPTEESEDNWDNDLTRRMDEEGTPVTLGNYLKRALSDDRTAKDLGAEEIADLPGRIRQMIDAEEPKPSWRLIEEAEALPGGA